MTTCPTTDALLKRVEVLERRQRHWARMVMVVAAVGLLVFGGWAPFDNLKPPTVTEPDPVDAPAVPTPTDEPEAAPVETGAEPAPESNIPTPSVAETIRDEVEPESVLTETEGNFQSFTHREGDETYLPSRMEWISLRASAELPRGGGNDDGYGIMYGPDGKGSNTIRVVCSYDSKRVNRERMEGDLKYIQMQLAGLAQLYGWDWLKVRIETRAVN